MPIIWRFEYFEVMAKAHGMFKKKMKT